jgi:nicotinate-nucleotide adenylyltransferase
MRNLGIMGGTFDPIHLGHLEAAEASRVNFALEKVIFVPAGVPPHKSGLITPARDRLSMVMQATKDKPYFEVSDFEVNRPGKSYTVDTIEYFRQVYGDETRLFFITGADAIMEILTWYNVTRLMEICEFIAVTRPGYAVEGLDKYIADLPLKIRQRVNSLVVPGLNISSTAIRNRVKSGQSIANQVSKVVENYIIQNRLYST